MPWRRRVGCHVIQRLEYLAISDSLITIVHVAKPFQVGDDLWKHFVAGHHDVDIEDRLCQQVGDGGAAYMFDSQNKPAKRTQVNLAWPFTGVVALCAVSSARTVTAANEGRLLLRGRIPQLYPLRAA